MRVLHRDLREHDPALSSGGGLVEGVVVEQRSALGRVPVPDVLREVDRAADERRDLVAHGAQARELARPRDDAPRELGHEPIEDLVQLLVGMAFATPIHALSAGLKDESAFSLLYRLAMIPLFLFSGAFFPVASLGWLEVVARVTPLWHGVDLTRMLTLGQVDWALAAVHVAYLVALALAGWFCSLRRLTARMVT